VKLRISKLALSDVEGIYAYTLEHWGAEQADRYMSQIWDTFARIVAAPGRWRQRTDVHPDCRICFSGRHAIIYRIKDGRVEIARVLHGAMSFMQHIPSDFIEEASD
jgi:toxin ParE1/3/4